MKQINKTSKEAIIGHRRKNQARTKIGTLLYRMFNEKKYTIGGIRAISSLLAMDHRVLQKHIGFRLYPQKGRQQYLLHLGVGDLDTIKETIDVFKRLKEKTAEEQKIAQYIFLHLIQHG